MEYSYNLIQSETGVPIKAWTKGVAIEAVAEKQLRIKLIITRSRRASVLIVMLSNQGSSCPLAHKVGEG
jgi:hypothetical protein